MSKLVMIISAILIAFILCSFSLYRLHLHECRLAQTASHRIGAAADELETADGRISNVDVGGKTVTLTIGNQTVIFLLDDETAVTRSGEVIQSSAIHLGETATVSYVQRGGHKKAISIAIFPGHDSQTL